MASTPVTGIRLHCGCMYALICIHRRPERLAGRAARPVDKNGPSRRSGREHGCLLFEPGMTVESRRVRVPSKRDGQTLVGNRDGRGQ